jgi:hypothetical protein
LVEKKRLCTKNYVPWKARAGADQQTSIAIASISVGCEADPVKRLYLCQAVTLLLGAAWLFTAEVRAEPAGRVLLPKPSPTRTEVVFGAIGIRAQPRDSLMALLAAELRGMRLSIVEDSATEPLSAWASQATRSRRVLAAILLDGRNEQGWRVIVIDAARGRAIARALPGGIRNDAASIEAVVSIVVSAASALREGLEVASTPLAAVVGGPSAPPAPAPSEPSAPTGGIDAPPLAVSPRRANWAFRGAIAASVASFSPAAPTTEGLGLTLGVSFRGRVEARAFGAAFMPQLIQVPFGEFRVARAFLGGAAGPVFRGAAFSFAPEAGFVAERLRRYDATPTAGVYATEPGPLYRFGGLLAFRLRHTLFRPVSVELVTGGLYFGRRVQFTAKNAESAWSEAVWPTVAFAQLGLEIATN